MKISFYLFAAVAVLCVACDISGGGGGTSDVCSGLSTEGDCVNVEMSSSGEGTVVLKDLSGGENFAFLISASANDGETASPSLVPYTITVTGPSQKETKIIYRGKLQHLYMSGKVRSLIQRRIDAEGAIRRIGKETAGRYSLIDTEKNSGEKFHAAVGTYRTFKILVDSSSGTYESRTFKNIYSGRYVEGWLDDDGVSVSETSLQSIVRKIDDIIVPRIRALFGTESDTDSNGVINILMSARLNEQASSTDGRVNIVGFFNRTDFTTSSDSNRGEYLYAVIPDVVISPQTHAVSSDEFLAAMAHELQHLVSYANHTILSSGEAESVWLDEGMSHLAEDVCGYGTYNIAFVASYLANVNSVAIAGGTDTAARRGGAMLLLRYLFEQAGGASYSASEAGDVTGGGVSFLKAIIANDTSSQKGIGALEAVTGRSFKDMLATFGLMMIYDNTGLKSDQSIFNLNPEITDPFTGQKIGLRLRGSTRTIDGTEVTLSGPSVVEFSGNMEENLNISGFDIIKYHNTYQGDVTVEFEISGSTDPFFFIVRLEDGDDT